MRRRFRILSLGLAIAFDMAVAAGAQAPPAAPQQAGRGNAGAAQQGRGGAPPRYPTRALADPAIVAHGKQLYSVNCAFCHGSNARGGEAGPNLMRSQLVLDDQKGELMAPVIQGGRSDKGMPAFSSLSSSDVSDIITFIHSLPVAGSGGGGPGNPANPLVGDAQAGEAYFNGPGKCGTCHSATGDLKGIGAKYDVRTLQGRFLLPGSGRGGAAAAAGLPPTTVTVTLPPGQKFEGKLESMDDFTVSLTDAGGAYRTFRRDGTVPKVDVHDPLEAHKDMLHSYTDKDIHDVTAYLVTLK